MIDTVIANLNRIESKYTIKDNKVAKIKITGEADATGFREGKKITLKEKEIPKQEFICNDTSKYLAFPKDTTTNQNIDLACFRSYYLYEYLYQKVDILKNNKDNVEFYANTNKKIGGENRKTKIEVVFYHEVINVWQLAFITLLIVIIIGIIMWYFFGKKILKLYKLTTFHLKKIITPIKYYYVKIKNFMNFMRSSNNTNYEFEKAKKSKNSDNFNNNQNLNTMYGKDKEILGIEQTLDTLIEKKTMFQKELSIASDAGIKFDLRKKIEDLDSEIAALREKLNQLVDKQESPKVEKLATTSHKTNSENMQTPIKIFISYSSADRKLREIIEKKLKVHLKSSKYKYQEIWTDVEIAIGDDWNTEIQDALKISNIGILLVSPDFLGSQYCSEDELKIMLDKRQNEGYLIVPILLRECNFSNNAKLKAMQFFKTYQSEYEVTDLLKKDNLMPFEDLADVENPKDRLLNRYFVKLVKELDFALDKKFAK